jgi:hypothetical protein
VIIDSTDKLIGGLECPVLEEETELFLARK